MDGIYVAVTVLAAMVFCASATAAETVCAGELERASTGYRFTEGPAWHPGGYLVFSDIPADAIFRLKDGEKEVYRRPSGNSNGLAFDAQGRLLACEHGNRRVSITRNDGTVEALAARYEGKRLNSPNDLAMRSDGSVYFTDPPYGVRPEDRELDFQGVYRIGPDGGLTLLVRDFVRPNGLAFSPDEKTLYVADTEKSWVRAFHVRQDGTLENGRVLARPPEGQELRPDGMKVDVEGNLYVTGLGGVWVFDAAGKHLETIETPERPANCAFGGPDRRTLYVTARSSVYRIKLRHRGATLDWRTKKKTR